MSAPRARPVRRERELGNFKKTLPVARADRYGIGMLLIGLLVKIALAVSAGLVILALM